VTLPSLFKHDLVSCSFSNHPLCIKWMETYSMHSQYH